MLLLLNMFNSSDASTVTRCVGCTNTDIGFIGCANRDIAQHFGKYF